MNTLFVHLHKSMAFKRFFKLKEKTMKLGIYKQAIVRNRPTAGCGRAFDNDCGISARNG